MAATLLQGCLPTIGSNGDFKCSQDIEVILQSIFVILNTPKGSRIWQPDFGCDLKSFLWDLLDDETLKQMEGAVENALAQWEPRISVKMVEVTKIDDVSKAVNVDINFSYEKEDYTKSFSVANSGNLTIYDIYA